MDVGLAVLGFRVRNEALVGAEVAIAQRAGRHGLATVLAWRGRRTLALASDATKGQEAPLFTFLFHEKLPTAI